MLDFLTYIAAHYWFPLLLIAFVAFCFFSVLTVCCLETHAIRQFQPGAPEEAGPPSRYFTVMNQTAEVLEFRHCGNFVQQRGSSLYRCCLSLWLSPDQNTLVVIGGGKLAKMDYKRTFFLSLFDDGKELVTVDAFGLADLSRTRDIDVVVNADLFELKSRHDQRVGRYPLPLKLFSPTQCLEQYEDLGRIRAETLVARGLARFRDRSESTWRYTIKGAWAYAVHGYLMGLKKAELQSDRAGKRRPGS